MITFVLIIFQNARLMLNALNKLLSAAGQAIAEPLLQIVLQQFIALKRCQFCVKMEVVIRIRMSAKLSLLNLEVAQHNKFAALMEFVPPLSPCALLYQLVLEPNH